jgi:hypothetical protein
LAVVLPLPLLLDTPQLPVAGSLGFKCLGDGGVVVVTVEEE